MGVDRKDYIVYGWELPPIINNSKKTNLWDDKFLPLIEGWEGEEFSLILGEDYEVFGLILGTDNGKYEGWDFFHLDLKKMEPEKLKIKYRKIFDLDEGDPVSDPYLFIFSHFH